MAAEAMDDEEFAAAIHMTFRHIDKAKGGRVAFGTFLAWWKRKDEEDEDGEGLADELLADAQERFTENDNTGKGLDVMGLAELLIALELEGHMELDEPEEDDEPEKADGGEGDGSDEEKDSDGDSEEDMLLDGLDDLEMSDDDDYDDDDQDEEEAEPEKPPPASAPAPAPAAAPAPPPAAEPEAAADDGEDVDAFEAELRGMKLSELRAQAKDMRVDTDELEEALDSNEPKEALVQLLIERKEEMEEDRAELEAMKMSELREMALDLGVDEEDLEDVLDDEEPKEAIIEMLLAMGGDSSDEDEDEEAEEGVPPPAAAPEGVAVKPAADDDWEEDDEEDDDDDDDDDDGLLDGLDDLDLSDDDEDQEASAGTPKTPRTPTVHVPVSVPKPAVAAEEEEEIGELDHEELQAIFASIDVDGNGMIDPDEFTTLCHQLDPTMTDDDMEDAFDTMDQDGDGEISNEDFEDWWLAVADMPVDDDDDDEAIDTQIAQLLLGRVMMARKKEAKEKEKAAKEEEKERAKQEARAAAKDEERAALAALAATGAVVEPAAAAEPEPAAEEQQDDKEKENDQDEEDDAVAEAEAVMTYEDSAFAKEFGAVALIITRMAHRKIMQRKAQAYMEQQRRLRAEQEYVAAGRPDARAKAFGWTDADHLAQVQYEADLADSTAGDGAGLDWGAGMLPQFSPPHTFFMPTMGKSKKKPDGSAEAGDSAESSRASEYGAAAKSESEVAEEEAGPSRHSSFRDFAHKLGSSGEEELHTSEAYSQLHVLHKIAQRQAMLLHKEIADDAADDRTRFLLLERQRLRKEDYRESVDRTERARMAAETSGSGKGKRSFKWRQAKAKVFPVAVLLADQAQREAARLSTEAGMIEADEAAYVATMMSVDSLMALLGSVPSQEVTAAAVVQLAPPLDVWETRRANDATQEKFNGWGVGEGGGSGTVALLEHYADGAETEGHAATALAVLLAAVSAADTLTRRCVASGVTSHSKARQITSDLLRMLNDSACGGVVWENTLSLLSFVIEADTQDRGEDSLKVQRSDVVLSPADQRVVLDLLLRMGDYVPMTSMGLWRSWLRAVHGIVVGSDVYSPDTKRHRRLDILCALEGLRRVSLHSLEESLLTACLAVVHTERDEAEMQKQLKAKPKDKKADKASPDVLKVGDWLKKRGLHTMGGGRLAVDHTRAVCASLGDAGYKPSDWVEVLKQMQRHEIREYISQVNQSYTPDGHRVTVQADASENREMAEDEDEGEEHLGPPPDQEAIAALRKAAGADATSKKSGDPAALLETALLYLEADKLIEAATASTRVNALVRNTLETKQLAVQKRLKSLRKKIDADVLDEAWTKRRLAGGGADTDKFYPAGGLYWMITNDDEYGAQQGPVDREGMATLMEMEAFWNENPLLMVYYAEGGAEWQSWATVRPQLGL